MTRKVIIDCDPGIADAVALCLALFDERVEVVAITSVAGRVSAAQANANVQAIVDQLDPPRTPRLGVAAPLENAPRVDLRAMQGDDGLGNAALTSARHHHQHPAEKIICDEVHAAPEQITILCLGPLTNVARAFQRDAGVAPLVNRLIIAGGSPKCIGDVTAAAEFNMHYDSMAARQVLRSPTTKTLIPLDVTRQIALTWDVVDELPDETTRAGRLLRTLLPFAFRAHRQTLGQESVCLHEAAAWAAVVHPELFETEEMAGDVEVGGELTTGATVFDRRPNRQWRMNMEVAVSADVASVADCLVRGFAHAGSMSRDSS